MAKSLGQIHTVNSTMTGVLAPGNKFNIDIPGQLTEQLQRMVRAGTFHKLVGMDITVRPTSIGSATNGVQVHGTVRYYLPTRGRCSAYREAFRAMAEQMKTQGLQMRDNPMYDFRAPLNDDATINTFPNQATLDGLAGLALNHSTASASIFGVHNENQQPQYTGTAGDLFNGGFKTLLQNPATGTDFVLNDTVPFTGNENFASLEYESIPFVCTWEPASAGASSETVSFQFRPDPALYIAVLCGQMQIELDDIVYVGVAPGSLELNVSTQISGWKSIMGDPDKKSRRSRRKSSKKKE